VLVFLHYSGYIVAHAFVTAVPYGALEGWILDQFALRGYIVFSVVYILILLRLILHIKLSNSRQAPIGTIDLDGICRVLGICLTIAIIGLIYLPDAIHDR